MQGLCGWLRVIRREGEREGKFEDEDGDSSRLVWMALTLWRALRQMAVPMFLACDGRMENGDYQVKSDIQCLLLDEIGQAVFVWFVGAVPASVSPTD